MSIVYQISMYVMAVLYIAAGINHFVNPKFYVKIMPNWMPWHEPLVLISGIAEVVLGVLLIPEATRPYAAWLIIAMLIVFFAVHIDMVVDFYQNNKPGLWLVILHVPLQFVFIWWAWLYTR